MIGKEFPVMVTSEDKAMKTLQEASAYANSSVQNIYRLQHIPIPQ